MIHDLPAAYGVVPCEWQECTENAVCLVDTKYGTVPVCREHARDMANGDNGYAAKTQPAG
jgi:hypothetical protein